MLPMTTSSPSNYSFTEKKRSRKDFGKRGSILEVPFLLAIQVDSYREFLQANPDPAKRADRGLHDALKSVFPIVSYNGYEALEYVGYKLGDPGFDEKNGSAPGRGRVGQDVTVSGVAVSIQ